MLSRTDDSVPLACCGKTADARPRRLDPRRDPLHLSRIGFEILLDGLIDDVVAGTIQPARQGVHLGHLGERMVTGSGAARCGMVCSIVIICNHRIPSPHFQANRQRRLVPRSAHPTGLPRARIEPPTATILAFGKLGAETKVSIHAPGWGRPCKRRGRNPGCHVSIHAPGWGRRQWRADQGAIHHRFDPRPRVGATTPELFSGSAQ